MLESLFNKVAGREIFKSTYAVEHLRTAASIDSSIFFK